MDNYEKKYFNIFLGAQLAFFLYLCTFFALNRHLPFPFFYDASNTFMDWFSTNYWAQLEGRYSEWRSIYPPFTFVLGKLFSSAECVTTLSSPFNLRDCDVATVGYIGLASIVGSASCLGIVAKSIARPLSFFEKIAIFFAVQFSLPVLYALERGNYVLFAFAFVSLSQLAGRNFKGALFLALAVNLKQYLLVLFLVPILKRDYKYFLQCVIFSLIINYISLICLNDANYYLVLGNMFGFAAGGVQSYFEKLWYATSFSAWVKVVFESPVFLHRSPDSTELVQAVVSAARYFSLGVCGAIFLFLMKLRNFIDWEEISFLLLCLIMVAIDGLGGYALIFLLPYSAWLFPRGKLKPVIPMLFVIFTSLDVAIGPFLMIHTKSFLSGSHVDINAGLTLGAYLRPIFLFVMMIVLFVHEWQKSKTTAVHG